MEVYLDNSATTKPTPEVIMAINRAFTEYYGNPSSLHRKGLEAERVLSQARRARARELLHREKQFSTLVKLLLGSGEVSAEEDGQEGEGAS